MKIEVFENIGNITPYLVGAFIVVWAVERIVSLVLCKEKPKKGE